METTTEHEAKSVVESEGLLVTGKVFDAVPPLVVLGATNVDDKPGDSALASPKSD